MSKVKIGTVQMSCVADKQSNLNKAIEKIKEAEVEINKGEKWKSFFKLIQFLF